MYGIVRAYFLSVRKGVSKIGENLPVMNYAQYRRASKLVRECCNYDNGNCIALDDGEECVCVQSISYSRSANGFVLPSCRWTRGWKQRCCFGST